jgi:large subunit ribosomal protein L23
MKTSANIIKSVQLTEKATKLMEKSNKYLFVVDRNANKIQIARAVEQQFKVSVVSVNTMNYEGKRKRERTVRYGRCSNWKRAVVTIKEGEKIDFV